MSALMAKEIFSHGIFFSSDGGKGHVMDDSPVLRTAELRDPLYQNHQCKPRQWDCMKLGLFNLRVFHFAISHFLRMTPSQSTESFVSEFPDSWKPWSTSQVFMVLYFIYSSQRTQIPPPSWLQAWPLRFREAWPLRCAMVHQLSSRCSQSPGDSYDTVAETDEDRLHKAGGGETLESTAEKCWSATILGMSTDMHCWRDLIWYCVLCYHVILYGIV